MLLFDYFINGLSLTFQGSVQLGFVRRPAHNRVRIWQLVLYCLLLDLAACHFGIMTEPVLLYAAGRVLYKSGKSVCVKAAVIWVCVSKISFGVINSVEALIFPYVVGSPLIYFLVFVSAAAAPAMCLLVCGIIVKRLPFERLNINLPLCLLLCAVEQYLFAKLYTGVTVITSGAEITTHFSTHLTVLALHILGFAALAYNLNQSGKCFKIETELKWLRLENRLQDKYVKESQRRYEYTKAFRHDIKNHFIILKGLLRSGSAERAEVYLKNLETCSKAMSIPVNTGNPTLDILLSEKLGLAETFGIETENDLAIPSVSAVSDVDLCVIFANAVDNAVNATLKVQGGKKITIKSNVQGDFLMLEFKNTCVPDSCHKPGTGMSNIISVAEKYGGAASAFENGGIFSLSVLLNISNHFSGSS